LASLRLAVFPMRAAAKIDANQVELVRQLRSCGVQVQLLSAVGKGCPDLLCGWRGKNILLEVKDGKKPPSAQVLTADQRDWHASWPGQVAVVNDFKSAMDAILEACHDREYNKCA
jgi:hypothetical protein